MCLINLTADVSSSHVKFKFSFFSASKTKGEYYTPKPFLFKDSPAYSFGVKNHHLERADKHRKATPSPLDYRPERVNEFGSSSRGFLFGPGADQRLTLSKKDAEFEPGPGENMEKY